MKRQNVLCVAHNPAISYLAESLTKAEIGDMPPCGLAIIKFNINSWKEVSQGSGELENYIYPGMLSE
jgi:phosphohistidine phosphatase